jgi:hypothetical protein
MKLKNLLKKLKEMLKETLMNEFGIAKRKCILGIDQGSEESGVMVVSFVTETDFETIHRGKLQNLELLRVINSLNEQHDVSLCIEKIQSFGMPVGKTTLDSCIWAGRFIQCFLDSGGMYFIEVGRKRITSHFNKSGKGNDSTIRQALIDRFEPSLEPGKRPCGILKGVSGDEWSALALVTYYFDEMVKK